MTAVPALALGLFRIPGLLHWWAWVVAAAAAGSLARRLGAPRYLGNLVTAATMLLPVSPLVPGFPAAEGWFLAALIPAMGAALTQTSRRCSFPSMMLMLGLATATRVQGLTWLAILLGLRMISTRRHASLLKGLGLLILGSAPWWLKNLILLSDPFAPIFWSREGVETLWRDGGALIKMGLSPVELLGRLPSIMARLTPAILPTFTAAGLTAISVRRNRPLFAAGLLGMAAWTATSALPRFFAPTLVLLIITAATWGRGRIFRLAAVVVVSGNLALGLGIQLRWLPLAHPLSIFTKDFVEAAPEVAPNPPSAAFRALDEILPPEAKLLLISEPRTFGAPRPVVAPSQHDPSPLRSLCEGIVPPKEFSSLLRQQGITHLVINEGELIRLGMTYPVEPWRTSRGEGRWWAFLRSLGPPLHQVGGVKTYRLSD